MFSPYQSLTQFHHCGFNMLIEQYYKIVSHAHSDSLIMLDNVPDVSSTELMAIQSY